MNKNRLFQVSFEEDLYLGIRSKANEVFLKITRCCNNHCIFCPDSIYQDDFIFPKERIIAKLEQGRKIGLKRVVLSGGEPTIHPDYINLIKFAKSIGFKMITTITNGRMFYYKYFAEMAVEYGLNDVLIKIHSENGMIHDKLTQIKGSFNQTINGINNLLSTGKCNLGIMVFINKKNYEEMPKIIESFKKTGINSITFFNVNIFGRALEYKRELFIDYNLNKVRKLLIKSIKIAKKERINLHIKKFPPNILEDFEEFIEDSEDFFPEIRDANRRIDIFKKLVVEDKIIPCFGKDCNFCFRSHFCEYLIDFKEKFKNFDFDYILIDREIKLDINKCISKKIYIKAKDLKEGLFFLKSAKMKEEDVQVLELENYTEGVKIFPSIKKVVFENCDSIKNLLDKVYYVEIKINKRNKDWLIKNKNLLMKKIDKICLILPNYERSTQTKDESIDIIEFLNNLRIDNLSLRNVPTCICKNMKILNMEDFFPIFSFDKSNRIDIENLAHFYLQNKWYLKSLRCRKCIYDKYCNGMHINYLINFGFKILAPILK